VVDGTAEDMTDGVYKEGWNRETNERKDALLCFERMPALAFAHPTIAIQVKDLGRKYLKHGDEFGGDL